ncbi:unnamed protein product [Coccothraustes coccothraustes]
MGGCCHRVSAPAPRRRLSAGGSRRFGTARALAREDKWYRGSPLELLWAPSLRIFKSRALGSRLSVILSGPDSTQKEERSTIPLFGNWENSQRRER